MPDFTSSLEKLDRGRRHIETLRAEVQRYLHADPAPYKLTNEARGRQQVIKVDAITGDVPAEIAHLVGEAAHCIRAALDHFANAVAPVGTPNPAFPVWRRKTKPIPTIKELRGLVRDKLGAVSRSLIEAVANEQPYLGGLGEYVWIVDEMDNIDKHRMLLVAGGAYTAVRFDLGQVIRNSEVNAPEEERFSEEALRLVTEISPWMKPADVNWPVTEGMELAVFPAAVGGLRTDFKFDIGLGEPELIRGAPIVATMTDLADKVDGLVRRLIMLA